MTDEQHPPGDETSPQPDADSTRSLSPESTPQVRIGPYSLLQKLGEGGMGEVWLAEQKTPVRRRVALKLIKRGMDSARDQHGLLLSYLP